MSLNVPTNKTFSCATRSLTGLQALLLPASDELVTMQGIPVGQLFTIMFDDLHTELQDGDRIVSEEDSTETYHLRGVKHIQSP